MPPSLLVQLLLTYLPERLLSVFALLLLIFYIFAVICTKLFGVHPNAEMQEWFGTVGRSMYTLFQIMTLESWSHGIVRPTMKIFPGVHYTMGGLWTTYTPKKDGRGLEAGAPDSMMTNIDGLYAFGEVPARAGPLSVLKPAAGALRDAPVVAVIVAESVVDAGSSEPHQIGVGYLIRHGSLAFAGFVQRFLIRASPNSLHFTSLAPSIIRAKS